MPGVAVVLGLAVAVIYGASDYCGGIATKRVSALWVLAVSQATGLTLGLVTVALDHSSQLSTDALVRGCSAGALGLVGLALLYTALAAGPMGVVAPLAAVVGAVIPVAWGLLDGERPSTPALTGVVIALVAVAVTTSREEDDETAAPTRSRIGIPLGIGGGACFGVIFVLLASVETADGMWPLVAWRSVSFPVAALAVLALRPRPGPSADLIRLALLAGALEVLGNGLYILAAREGLLSLVGVLGSLAPMSTVVFAWVLLRERLDRVQVGGLLAALGGIILIAAG